MGFIIALVLCSGLVVATAATLLKSSLARRRVDRTQQLLRSLVAEGRSHATLAYVRGPYTIGRTAPTATAIYTLESWKDFENPGVFFDEWRHLVRFASPGPIHRRGWDLWSCGPNGVDEGGEGDDIAVGEDISLVESHSR
jgi:hypothetical protein